jgi:hypothetical protein
MNETQTDDGMNNWQKTTELMVIYTESIMVVEMGPSLKKSC